jgi:hypothetical protein
MTTLIVQTSRKKKLALPAHMQRKSATARTPIASTSTAALSARPTVCANAHCPDPLSGHVTFDTEVGDNYCAICGEYQTEIDEESRADG